MISVIIPTYNEAEKIAQTITKTHKANDRHALEIIIADGNSTDETVPIAHENNAIVTICGHKGRAAQMNSGASLAKGDILYFLHADSIPPPNFIDHIMQAYDEGAIAGCFRLAFDYTHWFLRSQCWFTRFDINALRFGDQSLFVTKEIFEKCNGFREDLQIMEDQEIVHRIKKHGKFKVMNGVVTTSARKYLDNGVFRMQGIFYRIWMLYYLGYSQEHLVRLHRTLIRENKR